MKDDTEALRNKLKAGPSTGKGDSPAPGIRGFSTGCTTLNLACSGSVAWGMAKGHLYLLVGDPGSGKTVLSLTAMGQAARNPEFVDHRLIFCNAENGALMDLAHFYGPGLSERLEPLGGTREEPEDPYVLEDFYDLLDDALGQGPCVLLLDSMDALCPRAWVGKVKEDRKAVEKGQDPKGSYGTDKARVNSERLRLLRGKLRKTGSVFIMISQTRDNIGFDAMFNPQTFGGGNALTFYSDVILWTKVRERFKRQVKGKEVEIGILSQVRVKRNRHTGRTGTKVDIPIYWSLGVDDVGASVNFLADWKHWPKQGGVLVAKDLDLRGTAEELVQAIEERGLERQLGMVLADVWQEIEEACVVRRKRRVE